MADVKIVTDADFEAEVLKSDLPVLVDFWAPWCGPCRMVAPVLEKIAEQYQGRVRVVKLNTDENQYTSTTYGIRSLPTVALFKDGKVIDGVIGAGPIAVYAEVLDKHLLAPSTGSAQQ